MNTVEQNTQNASDALRKNTGTVFDDHPQRALLLYAMVVFACDYAIEKMTELRSEQKAIK